MYIQSSVTKKSNNIQYNIKDNILAWKWSQSIKKQLNMKGWLQMLAIL